MNVYKRLLNVITFGIIIYSIVATFLIIKDHITREIWVDDSKVYEYSKNLGLNEEYDRLFPQYFLNSFPEEVFNEMRKINKVDFDDEDLYDEILKKVIPKEKYETYKNYKIEYETLKNKILELEKSKRNNEQTLFNIMINSGIVFGSLILVLVINYISFGRFQLIHKMRK